MTDLAKILSLAAEAVHGTPHIAYVLVSRDGKGWVWSYSITEGDEARCRYRIDAYPPVLYEPVRVALGIKKEGRRHG